MAQVRRRNAPQDRLRRLVQGFYIYGWESLDRPDDGGEGGFVGGYEFPPAVHPAQWEMLRDYAMSHAAPWWMRATVVTRIDNRIDHVAVSKQITQAINQTDLKGFRIEMLEQAADAVNPFYIIDRGFEFRIPIHGRDMEAYADALDDQAQQWAKPDGRYGRSPLDV